MKKEISVSNTVAPVVQNQAFNLTDSSENNQITQVPTLSNQVQPNDGQMPQQYGFQTYTNINNYNNPVANEEQPVPYNQLYPQM